MDFHSARRDYIARFSRATEHLKAIEEACRREPDAPLRKSRMRKLAGLIDASGRAVLGDVFVATAADMAELPAVGIWFALVPDPLTGRAAITYAEAVTRLNALSWRDGLPVNGMLLDLIMAHHVVLDLIIGLSDPARFWRPDPLGLGTPVETFLTSLGLAHRALAGAVVVMKKLGSEPTFRLTDLPPCHQVGYPRLAVLEECV